MKIHNIFHISLLQPYQDNRFPSQIQKPPPAVEIDGEPEYELDEIIDSRLHYRKLQYRAKWTGYPPEHDKTWYTATNFENAEFARKQFHERYPGKPDQDWPGNPRPRRGLGTPITSTITSTSRGLGPSKTAKDSNPSRELGHHYQPTKYAGNNPDKHGISRPTRMGIGGSQNQETQRPIMDSVLQRRLFGTSLRQERSRVVPQRSERESPWGANSLPTEKNESCLAPAQWVLQGPLPGLQTGENRCRVLSLKGRNQGTPAFQIAGIQEGKGNREDRVDRGGGWKSHGGHREPATAGEGTTGGTRQKSANHCRSVVHNSSSEYDFGGGQRAELKHTPRVQKSWAEVVGTRNLTLCDQCSGERGANVTNCD